MKAALSKRKKDPKTNEDFAVLYNELEAWRVSEVAKIKVVRMFFVSHIIRLSHLKCLKILDENIVTVVRQRTIGQTDIIKKLRTARSSCHTNTHTHTHTLSG